MRTKDGNAIFRILRQHHGLGEAISAPDICRTLGWPQSRERLVCRIIADECAFWPDVVICAVPGKGFFCGATFDEIANYDNWLLDLAAKANKKLTCHRLAAKALGFNIAGLPPLAHAA